jgi:hypothetical protein
MKTHYKFQFNGDVISCEALKSMIKDGWELVNYVEDGGYAFLILTKFGL